MDPIVQAVIEGVGIGAVIAPIVGVGTYQALCFLDRVMPRAELQETERDEEEFEKGL